MGRLRLSRFKKPPVRKFPKPPPRRNRFDEDSDDDDDFVSRPINYKETPVDVTTSPVKIKKKTPGTSTNMKMDVMQTGSTSNNEEQFSSHDLKSSSRIVQDIANMLLLEKNCDLLLSSREGRSIRCHSFMLSARCPNLLNEVKLDKSTKSNRQSIALPNFSHESLKAFLWYIYTDQLAITNDETVLKELKDLASEYGIVIHPLVEQTATETSLSSSTDSDSNQSSQELFTTLPEKEDNETNQSAENEAMSEDLFADIENDLRNREKTETCNEDQDYFNELLSPSQTPPNSGDTKGSSSATPPSYDFETYYSATQLANILQYRAEHGITGYSKAPNEKPAINHADIKKQSSQSSGDEWGSGDEDLMEIAESLNSSVQSSIKLTSQQNFRADDEQDVDPFGSSFDDLCASIPESIFVESKPI